MVEYHYTSPRPRKYKGKFARELYIRTEIRFDTREQLQLVRLAVKRVKARSMNSWMLETVLTAAERVTRADRPIP